MTTRRLGSLILMLLALWSTLSIPGARAEPCKGTLYLAIYTGWMNHAEHIARTLNKYGVKATFFLANEKTYRGDDTLSPGWAGFWKARVAEGHAFGSHTWHHGRFRDQTDGTTLYTRRDGTREKLDQAGVCRELDHVKTVLAELTSRNLDPVWSAPGGRPTPLSLKFAQACGYRHVKWTPAGFLGDELPSESHPNDALLRKALRDIRDGDILAMHLGIRSRKDAWAPAVLDPLLAGLRARGFCFATMKAPG